MHSPGKKVYGFSLCFQRILPSTKLKNHCIRKGHIGLFKGRAKRSTADSEESEAL